MHDIFLSYSRTDSDIMQKVKQILLDADFNVLTVEHIEPGTDKWEQIAKQRIRKSDAVMCILSPEAKLSQWVKLELIFARNFYRPTCLVLAKGDKSLSTPIRYENFHIFDISQKTQFADKMKTIIGFLNRGLPATIIDDTPHTIRYGSAKNNEIKPFGIPLVAETVQTDQLLTEFQKTKERVSVLSQQFFLGKIDNQELQIALQECQIFTNNRWWMIGLDSGQWYSYNPRVGDWEVDTPPINTD